MAYEFRERRLLRMFTCFPHIQIRLTAYDQPRSNWGIDFAGGKVNLVYKPHLLEDLASAENALRITSEGDDASLLTATYYALETVKRPLRNVIAYRENYGYVMAQSGPHSVPESFLAKPWGKDYDSFGNLVFRALTAEQRAEVAEKFPTLKLVFTGLFGHREMPSNDEPNIANDAPRSIH